MSIEIVNGRVFVEGKETVNPELIGYAVLDAAEKSDIIICSSKKVKDIAAEYFDAGVEVNDKIDVAMKSLGKVG